ncbi:MAG: glucuronate isomerase [Boseongicola sp.]|nr:glucuronate isomerase [Boseongicola sp.]
MHLSNTEAEALFDDICDLPIVSPHGHTDPAWFAEDRPFSDASELLVIPDHYVFRMLYSQGVGLEHLGVGEPGSTADRREIFRTFAKNWHLFLGTPSRVWIEYVLKNTLGLDQPLSPKNCDEIFDEINARLKSDGFRPRALYERFGIEALATTDAATDKLSHHSQIQKSDWAGRVIPTFRPDSVIDPMHPDFADDLAMLGQMTGEDVKVFAGYLDALRAKRAYFQSMGATATDHAIDVVATGVVDDPDTLFAKVLSGASERENRAFHGHMLIEMARMSVEDGLVMQLHGGSHRNSNNEIFQRFGRDKGADIPISTDWVKGLEPLLNDIGNHPNFRLILFTLDESTYARELAPMAGHWPSLRIGPPWWFHDSPAGIARFFDTVVETAGYWNLAGFNDDTRAFLSIPARHDVWRRGVAEHLAGQVQRGYFDRSTASDIAKLLATDLARDCYKL